MVVEHTLEEPHPLLRKPQAVLTGNYSHHDVDDDDRFVSVTDCLRCFW